MFDNLIIYDLNHLFNFYYFCFTSIVTLHNMYLAQKNYGLWNMYTSLANSNGTYDYIVTANIDENYYTVIRENQYQIGQYITITEVNTYDMDSQLVKTEYK